MQDFADLNRAWKQHNHPLSKRFASLSMKALDVTLRSAQILPLRRLRKFAPSRVRSWYDRWKRSRSVFINGDRLVPELVLEQSFSRAVQFLWSKRVELGDYLEFGVFCGASLACMHRTIQEMGIDRMRLFGFDSFEGFPDFAATEDDGLWAPGTARFDYESARMFLSKSGVDWERVALTKGWFSDTLTPDLVRSHRISKASIIMLDCDLYRSSKEALEFCAPLIKDCAVIFCDDWNALDGELARKHMGQKRAFHEFLDENPRLVAEELDACNYTAHAKDWPNNAKVFAVSCAHFQPAS